MRPRARAWALLAVLTGACGPGLGQGTVADSGEGDSTTSEPTTSGASSGADVTGSSDSTDTTGGSDTTGEVLSVCDPQPAQIRLELHVDLHRPHSVDVPTEIDQACSVTAISSVEDDRSIEMNCADGMHIIDVTDLGPLDLSVGDMVTLRAHYIGGFYSRTHVSLTRGGEVVLAAMTSGRMPTGSIDPTSPPETFFAPLELQLHDDVCAEEPPSCGFLCDAGCVNTRRQALEFSVGEESTVIYDGTTGSVNDLQIVVAAARHHTMVHCSDTPGGAYRFVAMRTP